MNSMEFLNMASFAQEQAIQKKAAETRKALLKSSVSSISQLELELFNEWKAGGFPYPCPAGVWEIKKKLEEFSGVLVTWSEFKDLIV